ncbi:MAG: polysaccharide deacetylase family protein [Syntrophomonas sp.]
MKGFEIFSIFKVSFYFITTLLLAPFVNRPVILCFHRIGKSSGSLLDERVGVTDTDSFKTVINYLKIMGYRFVTLEHLINAIAASKLERLAVITFDDGYKDLYQNAFPVLKKQNIPFTLFLTTSTVESERLLWLHKLYIAIDKLSPAKCLDILKRYEPSGNAAGDFGNMIGRIIDSGSINVAEKMALVSELADAAGLDEKEERLLAEKLYLTKSELREMQKHGLSIEVHGHEHLPPVNLNRAETEKEIRDSISYIKQELSGKPEFFGLPYGISNKYSNDAAKNLNLGGVASAEQRLLNEHEDPYRLPRICVTTDNMHLYRRLARSCGKAVLEKMHLVKSHH